jgi:CheY-like chemotaxis protein
MSNDNTILLVEDDTFLIDILVQKFKSDGYTVIHAGDGETALKKVHENDPDLIFLDIILPGMNGFEVLKKLKDDDTIGNIPVAFLSNLGQKEDIEKGKRLGAVDFIVKANHSLDEIVDKAGEILASSPKGSTGQSGSGDTGSREASTATESAQSNQTSQSSQINTRQDSSSVSKQANETVQSQQSSGSAPSSGSADSGADSIPQAPSQE